MAAPLESLVLSGALAVSLRKIIKEKNEKEKLLIHKSKLASMGEMINNIAHQWKQPLMHMSYINSSLQYTVSNKELKNTDIIKKIRQSNNQLEFMSKTIDIFKDFYEESNVKEMFLISSAVQKAVDIMRPTLDEYKIELSVLVEKDKEINAYENEYSQVVLNLITNAKDALVLREIKNGKITININMNTTSVSDNAKGIKKDFMNKIFEPHYTSKLKRSGIGLYMSKTIIESHFKGSLLLINKKEGACFTIKV